jgi:hypothetical protein
VSCNATDDPEGGSRYNCTPWRGGIEIQTIGGSHTNHCTMTMWARGRSNHSNRFIITAGHCGALDTYQTFYHNGDPVGTSSTSMDSLNMASPLSDSRKVPAADNTTQMNRVYETPSTKSYAVTGLIAGGNESVGDWVCKLGTGTGHSGGLLTFGRMCGQIYKINDHWLSNGKTITGPAADFNGTAYSGDGASGGDSGAVVVYAGVLYGLADTSLGQFSTADAVQDDLNVDFCMTVDCNGF